MTEIQKLLYAHRDPKYAAFAAKLIPTLPKSSFIGVRTPEYKAIKKELTGASSVNAFLAALPHTFYEENILHGILLNDMKDFCACLDNVEQFLPYVDNWAVCDGLNPRVFSKHPDFIRKKIHDWISSDMTYTVRFSMHMIMAHFLGEQFDTDLLDISASLHSGEYYIIMMTAWLFAEALAKQWNTAIRYIEKQLLDKRTHNKAIQKAIESYRITAEQKSYLTTLKIK